MHEGRFELSPAVPEAGLRVTYIGYDFFSAVLLHLVAREDVRLMRVVSADEPWGEHVCRIARDHAVPLLSARASKADLAAFAQDSDLVLCAAYDYRLDLPAGAACRFLNLHPTLLPAGRGPAPIQWTLLEQPASAGVSLHVMTPAFDAGPIVSQVPVEVGNGTFEGYVYRLNQAAVSLVAGLDEQRLRTITARDQDETRASYDPLMPAERRTITPEMSCAEIARLIAAMGPMGAFVTIGGIRYLATRVEAVVAPAAASDSAYVTWFYACYPCRDGYCLFHRGALTAG